MVDFHGVVLSLINRKRSINYFRPCLWIYPVFLHDGVEELLGQINIVFSPMSFGDIGRIKINSPWLDDPAGEEQGFEDFQYIVGGEVLPVTHAVGVNDMVEAFPVLYECASDDECNVFDINMTNEDVSDAIRKRKSDEFHDALLMISKVNRKK
jgi:hypothetical protein